jgi:hypothetical protein
VVLSPDDHSRVLLPSNTLVPNTLLRPYPPSLLLQKPSTNTNASPLLLLLPSLTSLRTTYTPRTLTRVREEGEQRLPTPMFQRDSGELPQLNSMAYRGSSSRGTSSSRVREDTPVREGLAGSVGEPTRHLLLLRRAEQWAEEDLSSKREEREEQQAEGEETSGLPVSAAEEEPADQEET